MRRCTTFQSLFTGSGPRSTRSARSAPASHHTRLSRAALRSQRGVSLLTTTGFLAILMILGGVGVHFASSNTRTVDRSITRVEAVTAAESGVNFARATLWQAADPTDPNAVPPQTVTQDGATISYSGNYDSVSKIWTLKGVAQLPSENPGAPPVQRTVTSQVKVGTGITPTDNDKHVWSTLYVDDWQACTEVTHDAVIGVEMYVRGDLCLEDTSQVTSEAGKVQVWGKVDISDSGHVGTSADPLAELHVAGGCRDDGGSFNTPCTAADSTYATTFSDTPENLTMPPMDLAHWYANAKPGPLFPCNNGTSLPPGIVFDNNTTLDESNATFELTTLLPYDCQFWEAGQMVGRIAWTGGNVGKLTIMGTMFFDGDIHVRANSGVRADYDGQATLYTSGEIEVQEDVWLCGVAACDGTWDVQTDALVLVADGDGWHQGIDVEYDAKFQGGAYSLTEIDVSHNGEFWGSGITRRIEFINGTNFRHVPGGQFPVLPGAPQTPTIGTTLENVPGSYTVING